MPYETYGRAWWQSWAIVLVWFASAGIFLVSAVTQYSDNRALISRGVQADAVVVSTSYVSRRNPSIALQFDDALGRTVTAPEVHKFDVERPPRVGDIVRVVYDPRDPENVVSDVRADPDNTAPWILGGFGTLLLLGGVGALVRQSRRS